ncbi:MAG: helix-turn-helix domain-containing protein [Bacteroidia bacterium]
MRIYCCAILFFLPYFVCAQIEFRITEYPDNTPHDAVLHLTGDFNNWNPGDQRYSFVLQPDSSFALIFVNPPDSFDYKITRGNWSSVEGRPNGRHRRNHTYVKHKTPSQFIYIQIQSWEDLKGGLINIYTFILLLSAFQGLLLVFAINGIQDNNQRANRILSALILMISLAVMGRVSIYDREIFQVAPWLKLFPEIIFFLYGPTFYLYIRRLLKQGPPPLKTRLLYYLPAAVHLISIVPTLFKGRQELVDSVLALEVDYTIRIWASLALVYNIWFWYKAWKKLSAYEEDASKTQSIAPPIRYLTAVMILQAVCLGCWLTIGLVWIGEWSIDTKLPLLTNSVTDVVWGLFSTLTFILGYFAMNQPEIFKLPKTVEKYKDSSLTETEMSRYKGRLIKAMEQEEIYMNPELTLGELSDIVQTNTHTLSRVINEGYGKSFYDFINEYRVKAFAKLALDDRNSKETFLGLALRVGFNSKTTFNRAFKKVTGTTPRAYLKEQKEAVPAKS